MLFRFVIVCTALFVVSDVFSDEKSVDELIDFVSKATSMARSGEYVIQTHYQKFKDPPAPIPESVYAKYPELRERIERQQRRREQQFAQGGSVQNQNVVFRIVFDGEKRRIQRETGSRTTVFCTPYENTVHSFFFRSAPYSMISPKKIPGVDLPPPISEKLFLYNTKDFDEQYQKGLHVDATVPDVKTLGYFPDSIYLQTRFVDIREYLTYFVHAVVKNELPGLQIAHEVFKGSSCIKITFTEEIRDLRGLPVPTRINDQGRSISLTESEVKEFMRKKNARLVVEIYLDPNKNYAIRRMVQHNSLIARRDIVENELKKDMSSDVWYPVHWTYEQYHHDRLKVREENTLEVVSINQKIDPKRFTLESLGDILKPGTPVEWKLDTPPPGKGKLEWDGEKIFAHGEFGENWALYGTDPNQTRRRWIIVVSVNIAVISLIFVLHYLRKYLHDQ